MTAHRHGTHCPADWMQALPPGSSTASSRRLPADPHSRRACRSLSTWGRVAMTRWGQSTLTEPRGLIVRPLAPMVINTSRRRRSGQPRTWPGPDATAVEQERGAGRHRPETGRSVPAAGPSAGPRRHAATWPCPTCDSGRSVSQTRQTAPSRIRASTCSYHCWHQPPPLTRCAASSGADDVLDELRQACLPERCRRSVEHGRAGRSLAGEQVRDGVFQVVELLDLPLHDRRDLGRRHRTTRSGRAVRVVIACTAAASAAATSAAREPSYHGSSSRTIAGFAPVANISAVPLGSARTSAALRIRSRRCCWSGWPGRRQWTRSRWARRAHRPAGTRPPRNWLRPVRPRAA
jgi:hypothetical protein